MDYKCFIQLFPCNIWPNIYYFFWFYWFVCRSLLICDRLHWSYLTWSCLLMLLVQLRAFVYWKVLHQTTPFCPCVSHVSKGFAWVCLHVRGRFPRKRSKNTRTLLYAFNSIQLCSSSNGHAKHRYQTELEEWSLLFLMSRYKRPG